MRSALDGDMAELGPPPPRSAPRAQDAHLGMGDPDLGPPPPRSAPAASMFDADPFDRVDRRGGGRPPVFALTVLASDNRWETLSFSESDDLERRGSQFLAEKKLKTAFLSGLVSKMRGMVA